MWKGWDEVTEYSQSSGNRNVVQRAAADKTMEKRGSYPAVGENEWWMIKLLIWDYEDSSRNRSNEISWTWHQGQLHEQAGFLVSTSLTLSSAHVSTVGGIRHSDDLTDAPKKKTPRRQDLWVGLSLPFDLAYAWYNCKRGVHISFGGRHMHVSPYLCNQISAQKIRCILIPHHHHHHHISL